MKSFTFVSIVYNHEEYIEEHLNSIYYLVDTYGKGRHIELVLSDDASTDQTMIIAKKWVDEHPCFSRVQFIERKHNVGTVQNFIGAINAVKTEECKSIAGDDVFDKCNIFELFDTIEDEIVITPMRVTGVDASEVEARIYDRYVFLRYLNEKGLLKKAMRIQTLFYAAGTMFPLSLIKDKACQSFISEYKYIEDAPMFYYFIIKKGYRLRFADLSYVVYRNKSGISTNRLHARYNEFIAEERRLYRQLGLKRRYLPDRINPYMMWMRSQQKKALHQQLLV